MNDTRVLGVSLLHGNMSTQGTWHTENKTHQEIQTRVGLFVCWNWRTLNQPMMIRYSAAVSTLCKNEWCRNSISLIQGEQQDNQHLNYGEGVETKSMLPPKVGGSNSNLLPSQFCIHHIWCLLSIPCSESSAAEEGQWSWEGELE